MIMTLCLAVYEGVTGGRNALSARTPTTHASRHRADSRAVRRAFVTAVQPPASAAIRTAPAATSCSDATTIASSSFRRRVPAWRPSTVLPTCRRAATASSAGDRDPRRHAPVRGPSTRPPRIPPLNCRRSRRADDRVRRAISSPRQDRSL